MNDETKQAFQALNKQLEVMETRLSERIYDAETKLLSAFRDWSQPIEMRMRTPASAGSARGFAGGAHQRRRAQGAR